MGLHTFSDTTRQISETMVAGIQLTVKYLEVMKIKTIV